MRVSDAAGVNDPEFVSVFGSTGNFLDQTDPTTIYTIGETLNTNTRAAINFPAAGTYIIELLYRQAIGGAFVEVGVAEGEFIAINDTSTWELVGNPDDALVPPGGSRFIIPDSEFPEVPVDGSWNTTWYYQATTPLVTSLETAIAFLDGIGAEAPDVASVFSVGPINANFGFINFQQGDR